MRADRLLQLLLLLQTRQRRTAGDLARELGVTERTIYRDVDALSSAGVPIYASRGSQGGIALVEGWQTSLTGLTAKEVLALAAFSAPGALDDLGLGVAVETARRKLAAALPAPQRPLAEHARQRLHVDGAGWFDGKEVIASLAVLRDAVFQDRRTRIRYRDFDGRESVKEVCPYGLVLKAERWYLVAGAPREPRVFRGARIDGATLLAGTFERPAGFDLAVFWSEARRAFATKRPTYAVTLELTERGEAALRAVRPTAEHEAFAKAPRGPDGTKVVEVDFERAAIAESQLAWLAPGVRVLAPEPLRARLRAIAAELWAAYGEGNAPVEPGAPPAAARRKVRTGLRRRTGAH